jgi:transcriptional/translational regulatory protein YebC/TACO1
MSDDILNKYVEQAEHLKAALDAGDISQDEFNELIADMADVEKIQEVLDKENIKIKAAEIAKAISAVAGLI